MSSIQEQVNEALKKARVAFKKGKVGEALQSFDHFPSPEVRHGFLEEFTKMLTEPKNLQEYEILRKSAEYEYQEIKDPALIDGYVPIIEGKTVYSNEASLEGTHTGILLRAAQRGLPMAQIDVGILAANTGNLKFAHDLFTQAQNNEHSSDCAKQIGQIYATQIHEWDEAPSLEGVSIAASVDSISKWNSKLEKHKKEHPDSAMTQGILRTLADKGYPMAQAEYADMMEEKGFRGKEIAKEYRKKCISNPYATEQEKATQKQKLRGGEWLKNLVKNVIDNAVGVAKKYTPHAIVSGAVLGAATAYVCGVMNTPESERTNTENAIVKTVEDVSHAGKRVGTQIKKGLNGILKEYCGGDSQKKEGANMPIFNMQRGGGR